MNGYNFTERVRSTLAKAREHAVALGQEYVGPSTFSLRCCRAKAWAPQHSSTWTLISRTPPSW